MPIVRTRTRTTRTRSARATGADELVAWLTRTGTKKTRDGMARYGLPSDRAFGVPVGVLQKKARETGRDHDLATALWDTGWYEARLLAAYLGEPSRLTPRQMDRWCRDFDNWAVVDTVCFALFDRSPHAWGRVRSWSRRRDEFQRRAAFALLASLAAHDRAAEDARFLEQLPGIEEAAQDERNFVKKGVSWALRVIGRRNGTLHEAAAAVARRLADSANPGARWVGRDALRDLKRAAVQGRFLAGKRGKSGRLPRWRIRSATITRGAFAPTFPSPPPNSSYVVALQF